MKSSLIRKALLLSKREREFKPVLTKEDTEFLAANTNYSQKQITKMLGKFIIDCPQGTLSVDKVKEMMNIILPDEDSLGSITVREIIQVFAALYDNEGLDQKFAVERDESVFGSLDVNHDGDVTEEEFVKVCMKDREMLKLLREN